MTKEELKGRLMDMAALFDHYMWRKDIPDYLNNRGSMFGDIIESRAEALLDGVFPEGEMNAEGWEKHIRQREILRGLKTSLPPAEKKKNG